MLSKEKFPTIYSIWDQYEASDKKIQDTKGKELENIDDQRKKAIEELREIINQFDKGELGLSEFKTSIDSYNKRNNFWGFTATKGQMFFNQLAKNYGDDPEILSKLLKSLISEPKDFKDALGKIEKLEKFTLSQYNTSPDKRKAANPSSAGYFLSYFWQIHNHQKWPIQYTSLINAFKEIDIWKEHSTQKENYRYFYGINEEIKQILSAYSKSEVTNWDAEHAFWNFSGNPNASPAISSVSKTEIVEEVAVNAPVVANIRLEEYIIPKVAGLMDIGNQKETSSSGKGSQFEKTVAEIFRLLDFDVLSLGQGTGRNPDAILKFREENTAFLVDAKAYSSDYSLGIDDRAIKEYINYYIPKLQKDGYKKIGFIIVSNSFKSNFDTFINDITWNTDIKRFILLTSEALLYLLAYKTRDMISLSNLIESLVSYTSPVMAKDIIQKFDDV